MLLGLAGGVAGGLIGGRAGGSCEDLDCDPGVVYGLLMGEPGAGRRGPSGQPRSRRPRGIRALAALAIAGGGVAAAALADKGVVLVAVPILQPAAVIGIERRARANAADDPI